MGSMYIPKIIHQSYMSKYVPQEIFDNINKIKKINPNWEYRFYDDNDIINFISANYDDNILQAYNSINVKYGAARADFFRYLLIYKVGGVWLDIKATINRSLDETLKKNDYFLLSQWQNKMGEIFQGRGLWSVLRFIPGGEFQQWHIISAPNNPLIKQVIDTVLNNIKIYSPQRFGVGLEGVLLTTGPIMYSLSIAPVLQKYKYRFIDIHRDLNIDYSIYNGGIKHRNLYKTHYSQLNEPIILNATTLKS